MFAWLNHGSQLFGQIPGVVMKIFFFKCDKYNQSKKIMLHNEKDNELQILTIKTKASWRKISILGQPHGNPVSFPFANQA